MDRSGAVAQECTHRLSGTEGHQAFTSMLYRNQSVLDTHTLHELLKVEADRSGVPEETIMRCYYAGESSAAVEQDWAVGERHGVRSGLGLFVVEDGAVRPLSAEDVAGLASP